MRILGIAVLAAAVVCAGTLRPTPAADSGEVKPVNLSHLNTEADEDDPFVAPGKLHLFYASNARGNYNLMVSRRTRISQSWPSGKSVKPLNITDPKANKRAPFLWKDKFYYASDALPRGPEEEDFKKNFDLYYSVMTSPKPAFTGPTPVQGVCTEADELHPWVTPRGREFYFSRMTKDGWRVYVAEGPGLGAITKPKLVDLPVGFHHATLTPDALAMFLQGPLDKGRWGLFRTSRSRVGGAWAKPVELTGLNNEDGPRGDMSPSLSPDGNRLYFASDRPGGKGGLDIWVVLVSQLRK